MLNNERFWMGLLFFRLAFSVTVFLVIDITSGCGGADDGRNCGMADNCPPPDTDAGMPTPDSDDPTTNPDGNTTPDGAQPDGGNTDVCADYQWMADKPWNCENAINPGPYDAQLSAISGACYIRFIGFFWFCSTTDSNCQDEIKLTIVKTPPPAQLSFTSGGGSTTTCYQDQ